MNNLILTNIYENLIELGIPECLNKIEEFKGDQYHIDFKPTSIIPIQDPGIIFNPDVMASLDYEACSFYKNDQLISQEAFFSVFHPNAKFRTFAYCNKRDIYKLFGALGYHGVHSFICPATGCIFNGSLDFKDFTISEDKESLFLAWVENIYFFLMYQVYLKHQDALSIMSQDTIEPQVWASMVTKFLNLNHKNKGSHPHPHFLIIKKNDFLLDPNLNFTTSGHQFMEACFSPVLKESIELLHLVEKTSLFYGGTRVNNKTFTKSLQSIASEFMKKLESKEKNMAMDIQL